MTGSRELILGRVRSALGSPVAPAGGPAPAYIRSGELDHAAMVALLCERIDDYQATVKRVAGGDLTEAIGRAFRDHDAARVVVPAGVPAAWRPEGIVLVEDRGLSNSELDELDGVITGCTLAIAQTGTIVLTAGPTEGRRALTLVPDLHVCVIEESQIVELLPQAIAALAPVVGDARRPITFISGPSATSDIELNRVEGVHGPRQLVVFVVGEE